MVMTEGGGKVISFPRLVHPEERRQVRMRVSTAALPVLEGLAAAGETMPDPQSKRDELTLSMLSFRRAMKRRIDNAIDSDARRYKSGYYRNLDKDGSEKFRMLGLISISVHLAESMELAFARMMERADSGTSALFEAAFKRVSALLDNEFFDRDPHEVAVRFSEIEPVLASCLARCGLQEHAIPLERMIVDRTQQVTARVLDAYRALP